MLNKALIWISIIIIDFFLYLAIGLVLLNYEDFYDESEGAYWSLTSMTTIEKVAYISYYILIALNILLVLYVIHRLYKKWAS